MPVKSPRFNFDEWANALATPEHLSDVRREPDVIGNDVRKLPWLLNTSGT